jgi:glycosyltransferase involved in cell wall biosynthesis
MTTVWIPAIRAGSGADVYFELLAQGLRAAGDDVRLDWFPHRYELWPERLRRRRGPPAVDVIHANSWHAHALLGRGVPVVVHVLHVVHDPAYVPFASPAQRLYHRFHVRWREARAVAGAAAVVAISAATAASVARVFGRDDVDCIHPYVDLARFAPAPVAPDAGRFRLLWVGNPTRRKGVDLLPKLAERLGPRFEIRCVGARFGDALPRHPGLVALGRVDAVRLVDEYRQCDALLSLSRFEGFGYTVAEAMACARPVVGFACAGVSELVEPERTGWLEAVNDVDAIAARCATLARDPELARRLGAAGRERAERLFTAERAVAAYRAVDARVVARGT